MVLDVGERYLRGWRRLDGWRRWRWSCRRCRILRHERCRLRRASEQHDRARAAGDEGGDCTGAGGYRGIVGIGGAADSSEQVARRLTALKGDAARAAPAELGAGVWVDTVVLVCRGMSDASPDTSSILLDLGLDIHLEMDTPVAAEYANKRAEVLRKKREVAVKREERLKWEVEQVGKAQTQLTPVRRCCA